MTQFEKANEYFLNKQYEEAYQIYSAGNDRYSRFNTALMEVFGRGIPQDLQKAKETLEELAQSGLAEADEHARAFQLALERHSRPDDVAVRFIFVVPVVRVEEIAHGVDHCLCFHGRLLPLVFN